MEPKKFNELNLSQPLLQAINEMGFEIATPIQAHAIPPLREGKDVIGQAMTGTGKTVAFAIPAIEAVDPQLKKPQVIILCPTRELATQVGVEIGKLSQFIEGIHGLPIYGGQPIERQIRSLKKGPQIIIGTPGRVLDHLRRRTLKLDAIKMVILDEADEMLNMGFVDDIERVLDAIPETHQTVLFSATMPQPILKLTNKYQHDPILIKISHEKQAAPKIEAEYFRVHGNAKLDLLLHLLEIEDTKRALIFCNTKRMVDTLVTNLNAHGHYAEGLHGDMPQNKRDRVMDRFRKGEIEILVATDVAARGIDVENIETVFNYDIPTDEEYYIHRIGRTGRAGKAGKAFTFINDREFHLLRSIEKYLGTKIKQGKVPLPQDAQKIKMEKMAQELKVLLQKNDLGMYRDVLMQQMNEFAPLDIAAALLKMLLTKAPKITPQPLDRAERPQKRENRPHRRPHWKRPSKRFPKKH